MCTSRLAAAKQAEEQRQQQLLAEAQAAKELNRQAELERQVKELAQEVRQQQQQRLQREADAAAAREAEAEEARQQAWAAAQSQTQEAVDIRQANEQPDTDVTGHEASKERNWTSSEHWLPPPKGSPQVTVVGEQPRGWPAGAAFPALPPPNIFRGQG